MISVSIPPAVVARVLDAIKVDASVAIQAAATGVSALVIEHLRKRNANRKERSGWPKSNYWAEASESVTTSVTGDANAATARVSVEKEGAALHYYGGTVKPKKGKNLAIPLDPAVASIWPSEFPKGRIFRIKAKSGKSLLAGRDGDDLHILYLLLPSVTHSPDPSVLPSSQALSDAATRAISQLLAK